MEEIKQVKMFGIILCVVFIGVGLFDLGFFYIYKEALGGGSCELCFELNPEFADCSFYDPVNFSNLNLKNITVISYEK